ncbi:hypothetical protein D3C78_556020 [compost metagenome]
MKKILRGVTSKQQYKTAQAGQIGLSTQVIHAAVREPSDRGVIDYHCVGAGIPEGLAVARLNLGQRIPNRIDQAICHLRRHTYDLCQQFAPGQSAANKAIEFSIRLQDLHWSMACFPPAC